MSADIPVRGLSGMQFSFLLELQIDVPSLFWQAISELPNTVPFLQMIINNTSARRLVGHTETTVHTGIASEKVLNVAFGVIKYSEKDSVENTQLMQKMKIMHF